MRYVALSCLGVVSLLVLGTASVARADSGSANATASLTVPLAVSVSCAAVNMGSIAPGSNGSGTLTCTVSGNLESISSSKISADSNAANAQDRTLVFNRTGGGGSFNAANAIATTVGGTNVTYTDTDSASFDGTIDTIGTNATITNGLSVSVPSGQRQGTYTSTVYLHWTML